MEDRRFLSAGVGPKALSLALPKTTHLRAGGPYGRKVDRLIGASPGAGIPPVEPTAYVRPDIFIVELDGKLRAILNEYCLPRVSVSEYYMRLLKETDERETRQYLQEKMRQAQWLMNGLRRRHSTLQQCADAILKSQYPFFAGGTDALSPMSLRSLAEKTDIHPSTFSRAASGKFLQCHRGTYPLRYFFTQAVGGQEISGQAIRQRILALIRGEDPLHPLSDRQICELLSHDRITVARRTVAKYRDELGIAASFARKNG